MSFAGAMKSVIWRRQDNVYTGGCTGGIALCWAGCLLWAWRYCGAATMNESDIGAFIGYCVGSFGVGYFIGLKIKAIKQFVESI